MTHLTGFACPPAALRSAYGTSHRCAKRNAAGGQANPVKWVMITAPWYKAKKTMPNRPISSSGAPFCRRTTGMAA